MTACGCVGALESEPGNSGVDRLRQYLKKHREAVKMRRDDASILVILDWDATNKKQEFDRLFINVKAIKTVAWPDTALNPRLGKSFRGIERAFSDRLVAIAEEHGADIGTNKEGVRLVEREVYESIKKALNALVKTELTSADLDHCRPLLESLFDELGLAGPNARTNRNSSSRTSADHPNR